jgi:C4-dicarboxylate-specific signal transduction histidine kinase
VLGWWIKRADATKLEHELLESQAKLEEANRLRYMSDMATAAAHQLNQPIGIIRAATDAALRDIEDNTFRPQDIQPLFERMLTQTDRLATIIENFRRFSRGDRTLQENVKLNLLIERIIEIYAEQFKYRNITLHIELCPEQPTITVRANSFLLEEVLINLLTNARDAVEKQKNAQVWIKTWQKREACGFTVEDNGPGIAPEYRKQMFVPFVSTKPTQKGTGLGLYISHRIIDDLGGYLCYQDRPGRGASFTVNLPSTEG